MDLLTARINLSAIERNTAALKRPDARLMCVVKADAYNHGVAQCVQAMEAGGADAFGVATFEEAREIRPLTSLPVLAWIWIPGQEIPLGIELGVPTMDHLRYLVETQAEVPVHLMLDTGMNRSGIDEEDWAEAFELAKGLNVVGLMSHLACADEVGNPFNATQSEAFARGAQLFKEAGLTGTHHLSNSPATMSHEALRYDMVRPGIALYGLDPHGMENPELEPAMTWVARISAVKRINAGEGVSYGQTWTAPEDGYTAVIPAGYADGVQRNWQGHLEITIGGTRYPQVGRVCMDQIIVWLGEDQVAVGDEAIIFGEGGMSATELANRAGTINYEVACSPTGRTVREFVRSRRCDTAEDTKALGAELAGELKAGDVVILDGPLGAGKTTFTQGLAEGLGVKGRVTSPTFIVAREHASKSGGPNLVHVDAYRLGGVGELDSLDLDTALEDAVVVAEWGAGLVEDLAERCLLVRINRDEDARVITWGLTR